MLLALACAAADSADRERRPEPDGDTFRDIGGCQHGVVCVTTPPFHTEGDTRTEGTRALDAYECSPETDESGPELAWEVDLESAGFLSAVVRDGEGVDIDVHLLSPGSCVDRGDDEVGAHVEAGMWMIVADPLTILTSEAGWPIVAAAGYETGPGNLEHIAGTPEESHRYLGTGHLDTMTVGFAEDQTLPLGPILCN